MRMYFDSTDTDAGMICEEEVGGTEEVFHTIKEIHRKSVEDLGGTYRDGNEKTCTIPLARTKFFEVRPWASVCGCYDKYSFYPQPLSQPPLP